MKRPVLVFAAVALAAAAAYSGYRSLASDETKIRWLLDDAAESFNDSSVLGCLGAFHADYKERTNRFLDKGLLSRALFHLCNKYKDRKSGRFLFRVRLPTASRSILVEQDGKATATFQLHLEIQEKEDSDWREAWSLNVDTSLRNVDGEWFIHRSSIETISGNRPR